MPPQNERNTNVLQHPLALLELKVLLPINVGKTPVLWNIEFLATGRFGAATTEGFLDEVDDGVLATDGQKVVNIHPGNSSIRLSPAPRIPVCSLTTEC